MTSRTQYTQSKPDGSHRRMTIGLSFGILACLTAAVLVVATAAATPSRSGAQASPQKDADALVASGAPVAQSPNQCARCSRSKSAFSPARSAPGPSMVTIGSGVAYQSPSTRAAAPVPSSIGQ